MTQHPHACCPLRAGFTGADLQNLMNEAAILAARRNLKEISKEEISDALERIVAGPEKKGAVMTEQKKRLVAYHEVRLSDRLSTAPFLHANAQVVAAAYGSRLSVQAGHAGCAMLPVASCFPLAVTDTSSSLQRHSAAGLVILACLLAAAAAHRQL